MSEKQVFALTLLCIGMSFLHADEVVFTFEPLGPYERLAYRWQTATSTAPDTLILYAQEVQSLYVTRRIGSWNRVPLLSIGFVESRRDVFFRLPLVGPTGTVNRGHIYHLRGSEGIVTRIFANKLDPRFALTHNGSQLLITDGAAGIVGPFDEQQEGVFFLYDTETLELVHEFRWFVREAIGRFLPIRNPDGMFTVIYSGAWGSGDGVFAVATINPESRELQVLWDRTDWGREDWQGAKDFQRPPSHSHFPDDRGAHQFDRTLHLEEVIFAPSPRVNNRAGNPGLVLIKDGQCSGKLLFMTLVVAGILFLGITIIILKMRKKV